MSERHEEQFLDLAARVADGDAIDWKAAERTYTGPIQRLRGLRAVHDIARVHREAADDANAANAGGREELPFRAWGSLELLEPVASGGFGEVFRAHDRILDRIVALKLLRPEPGGAKATGDGRFIAEARRLAGVRHPNVVTVFGADRFNGRDGLWMEWIEGETLEESVKARGPWGAHEAALVGIEACRALAAVHAAGLVHRDVKLSNLVRERGGRFVLMDFGSSSRAGRSEDGDEPRLTGTLSYLAPESFEGSDSGAGTDLYALGVALYRLTSGEYPLQHGPPEEFRAQHRRGAGVPLRDRNPDLPTAFVRIVERALHPDPAQRFTSAGDMERALDAFVSGSSQGSQPGAAARRSRPAARAAVVLALVAAAGYAAYLFFQPGFQAEAAFYRFNPTTGAEERLEAGSRVARGEQLFLQIETHEPTWVYVINEDTRQRQYLLFPLEGFDTTNPLPGEGTQRLPGPIGGVEQAWDVTTAGGEEALLVVASRRPLDLVERTIRTLAKSSTSGPRELGIEGVGEQLRGLGGLSPAPVPRPGGPSTLEALRNRVAMRYGGARDVKVWELTLSNPE